MRGRPGVAAICATSVVVTGLAMACHEWAHVLTGWLVGGTPTLITSTEVKGSFASLSPGGFVAFGLSGSAVNVAFCALGWWILRREPAGTSTRLFAWFSFAVNGMLVATKMLAEPASGFGDWMTVLGPLPGTGYLRIGVTLLGAGALVFLVPRCGRTLGHSLVPGGEAARRKADALRIVFVGAAAATVLVLGGALASPVGTTRGTLLALGAGLGPYVPILFGVRHVVRVPPREESPPEATAWPWYVAAVAVAGVLWFVMGPGVRLGSSPF